METGGKVPNFSLRPHPVVTMILVLVVIAGLLVALMFSSQEDGTGAYRQRAIFTLVVTTIVSICLAIVATSKMWFLHLWKKNSTHDRHRRHTRHHPIVKQREFDRQR
jgi:hypothetical protein